MPLSDSKPRHSLTERTLRCQGYRRDDGLWEVQARLTDTRTYVSPTPFRTPVLPGEAFHDMHLRLAFDDARCIREIEVSIDSHPFPECPSVAGNFERLAGLVIGPGFQREVHARVGGEEGCTHVLTLLSHAASVAMQTVASQIRWNDRQAAQRVYGVPDGGGPPPVVGACRGYARDSEMVRQVYPEFHRPRSTTG